MLRAVSTVLVVIPDIADRNRACGEQRLCLHQHGIHRAEILYGAVAQDSRPALSVLPGGAEHGEHNDERPGECRADTQNGGEHSRRKRPLIHYASGIAGAGAEKSYRSADNGKSEDYRSHDS